MSAPAPVSARVFLSWAHEDRAAKERLLTLLMPRLSIVKGLDLRWWADSDLRTGEAWRRSIVARLGECDYALQLLSPNFFSSSFIIEEELPPFVGTHPMKGALPVALEGFPLDGTAELFGVDSLQIFMLDGRSFGETPVRRRPEFCNKLADAIRRRILGEDEWRRV